ncbi:MAG: hypothetical protein WBI14_05125 [Anaerolineaceae bacterium]
MPTELTESQHEQLKWWPKCSSKVSEELSIKPIMEKMMAKMKADIAAQEKEANSASDQAKQ